MVSSSAFKGRKFEAEKTLGCAPTAAIHLCECYKRPFPIGMVKFYYVLFKHDILHNFSAILGKANLERTCNFFISCIFLELSMKKRTAPD